MITLNLPFFCRLVLGANLLVSLTILAQARDKAPAGLYEGYTGFAISAEPVLPAKEIHPSLWFKAADLPALKASVASNEFAKRRLVRIELLADLTKPLPAAPAATDKTEAIHKYYGAMSIAARAQALLSLLAAEESARSAHRQRAEELLLRAYDGPIFQLDSNVKSSAVDEIYRGSWLQNYAHAYDCIQPTLSTDADKRIRERLAREAECVYENLFAWTDTSPHNHLSKPAWGLGSMALALSSHPQAKAWLGRAIEAANKNTRYFFSGDGIYREGSHYLVFSLTNFVPFLYHYRNVSGVDGFTAFQPVFEYMVQVRNGSGWLPSIEDAYIRPTPTHLVAAAYRAAKTQLHSSAPLSEILTWSYRTCNLSAFDNEQGGSGLNYTGASWDYPLDIDELLTFDPTIKSTVPDTAPNIFLQGGQTVLRNSWTADTPAGQRHLLFHGVAVADNHNHDDQLSFILQAEGQMMCSDSGYSRGTYAGAERTAWYNTAAAHNTLTFDGKPASKEASNVTPPSFNFEQPGLVGTEKKTTLPKSAVWSRFIFWIAEDYYAIIDRVNSKQAGELKSYLHGGRGTLASAGPERTWTYAKDRYGSAAKLRSWIAAPGATTVVKEGELTYIKGDYAVFPYLETTSSQPSAPWITLLKPAGISETTPFVVQDRSTDTLSAFVVTVSDHTTVIAARSNRTPPAISLEGIETDATLLLVRRDLSGKVLNHFVRDATYLKIGGETISP